MYKIYKVVPGFNVIIANFSDILPIFGEKIGVLQNNLCNYPNFAQFSILFFRHFLSKKIFFENRESGARKNHAYVGIRGPLHINRRHCSTAR
jgi:hypothetical protein